MNNPKLLPPPRSRTLFSRLFLHNWRAKLGSLVAAGLLWYGIKREIEPLDAPPAPTPPAVKFP